MALYRVLKCETLHMDFEQIAAEAFHIAQRNALAAGHSIVYVDPAGRYIEQRPDGRRFEVRLDSSQPRESHRIVIREIGSHAA